MKKFLLLFFIGFSAGYLLANPAEVGQVVRDNMKICLDILIPSLFPFMFLSVFIVKCGIADSFGKFLEPVFRKVFKLPGCACGAMLTAFIGGYPAGAKSVVELYKNGSISLSQAKRMAYCCFCAGPAFMVGTVGQIYLGNPLFGAVMIASQIIGALILTFFSSFGKKSSEATLTEKKSYGLCDAFVLSVSDAASAMLSICALVLVFGVIKSAIIFNTDTFWKTLVLNSIEITGDLELASRQSFAYISFITTFGGFCVHAQIFSISRILKISKIRFILFRILHASVTTAISLFILKIIPSDIIPSATVFGHEIPTAVPNIEGSAALIMLCIITVLVLPVKRLDFFDKIWYNVKKERM